MLYDILIIDDDFSGETVLAGMKKKSSETQDNSASWDETIMPLYFDLTRENLRVIWSTGELDDIEKFNKHELSKVKHIICDLHLLGIANTSNNKTIIAKIAGILNKLDKQFCENSISFLVNSKYIGEHSNIEVDLRTKLNESYPNKYTVAAFSEKNAIKPEQKKDLLDTSLLSHIKEQIITKHLKLEQCFDKKNDANEELRKLRFSVKHIIVKKMFNFNDDNSQIKELNKSRNYIAHHEINSLADLKDIENLKKFKKFSDLTNYLDEIDMLITSVRDAPKK